MTGLRGGLGSAQKSLLFLLRLTIQCQCTINNGTVEFQAFPFSSVSSFVVPIRQHSAQSDMAGYYQREILQPEVQNFGGIVYCPRLLSR